MKEITHDQFWSLYPKKVSKGDSERAWNKIKHVDREKIIACLPTFPFPKDRQFIPYPASWLNKKRWLDEFEQEKPCHIEPMKDAAFEAWRQKQFERQWALDKKQAEENRKKRERETV